MGGIGEFGEFASALGVFRGVGEVVVAVGIREVDREVGERLEKSSKAEKKIKKVAEVLERQMTTLRKRHADTRLILRANFFSYLASLLCKINEFIYLKYTFR